MLNILEMNFFIFIFSILLVNIGNLFNIKVFFVFFRLEFEARNFKKEAKEMAIIKEMEKVKLESY